MSRLKDGTTTRHLARGNPCNPKPVQRHESSGVGRRKRCRGMANADLTPRRSKSTPSERRFGKEGQVVRGRQPRAVSMNAQCTDRRIRTESAGDCKYLTRKAYLWCEAFCRPKANGTSGKAHHSSTHSYRTIGSPTVYRTVCWGFKSPYG